MYNYNMEPDSKKSHILLLPYGMYCDYDKFLTESYSHLADEPKLLLFISPTFNVCSSELMTFCSQEFAEIEEDAHFDRSFLDKLNLKYNIQRESFVFEREELLFRHVRYIKNNLEGYRIFPLFYSTIAHGVMKSIINNYWGECSFIFLTTMSVGLNYNEAKRADEFHASELEQNRANDLTCMDFSAFQILPDLVEFNKANNFVFRRIALQNSGDIHDNLASTTGYGAWYVDEDVK